VLHRFILPNIKFATVNDRRCFICKILRDQSQEKNACQGSESLFTGPFGPEKRKKIELFYASAGCFGSRPGPPRPPPVVVSGVRIAFSGCSAFLLRGKAKSSARSLRPANRNNRKRHGELVWASLSRPPDG
jgi:hypothetical protein